MTNHYISVYISASCSEGVVYVHSENTSRIEEGVISLLHPCFHSFTFLRHGLIVQDIESSTAAMENLKGTILSSSDSDGLQIEYPLSFAVQDIAGSTLNAIFLIISRACRLLTGVHNVFILLCIHEPSNWFSLELFLGLVSFNSSCRYARSKMRKS